MEHQLWKSIVALLATLGNKPPSARFDFSDERIVQVFYWAVIHDRPISWACSRKNWPIHLRRQRVPSNSTMSRRLRTAPVRKLLDALEQRVVAPKKPGLFWVIDGKPLVIGGASHDRQAGFGRAVRGKARGYKIHAIVGREGIAAWRHQNSREWRERCRGRPGSSLGIQRRARGHFLVKASWRGRTGRGGVRGSIKTVVTLKG